MEHAMEILPRAMKPAVHRTQHDRPHTTEDQKCQSGALGLGTRLGAPGLGLLLELEGVDGEDELGDGEGEHEAEEDSGGLLA